MVPAEHTELPMAAVPLSNSNSTQPKAVPASAPPRNTASPVPGLLPALKMQVEALEDKELEMRL